MHTISSQMDQEVLAINNNIRRVKTSFNFGNSSTSHSKTCLQISSNDENVSTKVDQKLTIQVYDGLSSSHLRSLVLFLAPLPSIILPLIAQPEPNPLASHLFNFNKFTTMQTRVASKRRLICTIKTGFLSTSNTKSR